MDEKSNLELLKEDYSTLQQKYDLPDFSDLNRDFKIEKLSDHETDFLIREIRSMAADTVENFLRFVEALLNPVNVPMFLMNVVKNLGVEEKEKLVNISKKIGKLELKGMRLINYSEEAEANFVKDAYSLWQEIKKDFLSILDAVEDKWDSKKEKDNKNYFG